MKKSELLNGVINLDKPKEISSQYAVTRVKRIIGSKKAGHAGTLDPLATGVLLVCSGEATKITRFLFDLDKEYVALMKLGEKTDTFDSEGKIIRKVDAISFTRDDVEKVVGKFTGDIDQKPPMYSAIKIGGKPLYKFARQGIDVERLERKVHIREIEITGFNLPLVEIRVVCSKGTYIRSLCNDIGDVLGVGAHITGLRRTRIGNFIIKDSVTLDELAALTGGNSDGAKRSIISIDDVLRHFAELSLSGKELFALKNGVPLKCPEHLSFPSDECIKLKDTDGKLFAIGRVSDRLIKIERMLNFAYQP